MKSVKKVWKLVLALSLFSNFGFSEEKTLRIATNEAHITFDYGLAEGFSDGKVIPNLMEGLLEVGDGFRLISNLAEKWETSQDGLIYTFKLRDAKWSDGVPVKAKDFVFAWKRVLTKKLNAPYASYLFGIKNAKSYYDGKVLDFNQVGIKAVDDKTFIVSLEKPLPYFLYITTFWATYPLREDVMKKKNPFSPGNMVTTGPFVLKDVNAQKVTLERNKNFYGNQPNYEKIIMYYVANRDVEKQMFANGEIDVLMKANNEDVVELKKNGRLEIFSVPQVFFLEFNSRSQFFNNINLRKAFAHGFDKNSLVRKLGNAKATKYLIPNEMFTLAGQNGLDYNEVTANRFFTLAQDSIKNKPIELCTAGNVKVAEAIIETLKQNKSWNLNYKITIASTEQITNYKRNYKCDMYFSWWIADYPDPENFLAMFSSDYNGSITTYRSKKFDDYLKVGVNTLKKEDREKIYSMAEKTLLEEDVGISPLYFSKEAFMLGKRVKSFYYCPLGYLYLKYAEIIN